MTDEEKTLEEQTETIIDALEAEDRPEDPESPDEVREEAPAEERDLREEISELRREMQQLRGGLRGVGHPEMIQTHVDNFLAKIAGEVPADENVRTSQEFWLNEIAKWTAGQSTDDASTKKIYWHTVRYTRTTTSRYRSGYFIILNNSATPIVSADILAIMKTPGFVLKVYNGHSWNISGGVYTIDRDEEYFVYNSDTDLMSYYRTPDDYELKAGTVSFSQTPFDVVDLGVNPIN